MTMTRSRFSLRQAYDGATPQENGERVSVSQRNLSLSGLRVFVAWALEFVQKL